jgi:hypothetical protein
MQPTCREYTAFLDSLRAQPYAVQAAAFWAMEAIYNQVRTRRGPDPAPPCCGSGTRVLPMGAGPPASRPALSSH